MNVLTEKSRFSGITENLYNDYDTVKTLYPYDFKRPDHWLERITWLDSHPGADPVQVSDTLMALNLELGATERTLSNIKRLSEKDCLSVVTGQQTGLFTGPLYTLYKASTVIKQARALSEKTGRPVVPIFWMATEDHDYAEIAINWYFDGSRIKRMRLDRQHRGNMPVGALPVSGEFIKLCEKFCSELDDERSGPEMAELLRDTLAKSKTLGDWFGRLILDLFAPWGLVVLDPAMPEMRRVMTVYFENVLKNTRKIQKAFDFGTHAVLDMGFNPAVSMDEFQTGLFLIDHGERIALYSNEEGTEFSDRYGKEHWSLTSLLDRLQKYPSDFSTGVVLRPVLQDWLLPVAAVVLGPSEAAYHGQLGEVFNLLDRQLPVIVPRESWVLAPDMGCVDTSDIAELINNSPEEWLSDRIMNLADPELQTKLSRYQDDSLERFNRLITSLPVNSEVLEILSDRAAQVQEKEMKWMRKQIRKHLVADADKVSEYRHFARMIKPMGKVQERTLLPWYFLSHFGRDLLNDLTDMEFSIDNRIYTGGKRT